MFKDMKPITKITLIVCATAILIFAMYTGNLSTIIEAFK